VPSFGGNHDFTEVERQIKTLEQELRAIAKSVK
jgi:hypothetical protein